MWLVTYSYRNWNGVTRILDRDHAVAIAERLKSEGKIKVAVHGLERAVDDTAAAQQRRRQGRRA
jgi:hypothetical protein